MVTKRSLLTKREHLKRKLRQLFADREKEINLFRRFVTDGDDYHLLHVMGIGGIGKTALLEAFGSICDAEQIPWVLANVGDQELPISLVRFIASQLTKAGLTLSHLQEALARYELLDQKVRADKRIRPEVLRVILTGMTSRSDVGEKDAGQQAQQALSYLAKVLGGEDANFYLNPAPQFTEALLADLAGLANTQRVCLMFDRYERISAYLR